jgi:hypothetical protein
MPELAISPEKVGFLIQKAREFDVKEGASDPDSGSNAADDEMIDVLQDNGKDPVVREIVGFIDALSVDEQIDLVANAAGPRRRDHRRMERSAPSGRGRKQRPNGELSARRAVAG